uniref:Tyrosinase_Cu-bd domain-containing protein n=1 Tax=Globodera pallida TaxID=36090 RepID=A0A183CDZ5_GLOPA
MIDIAATKSISSIDPSSFSIWHSIWTYTEHGFSQLFALLGHDPVSMPTFRKPTPAEKAAQPPPSVVSERYACFNTSCLRAYMHGFDSPRSGHCPYGRRSRRGSSKRILAKCERMEYRMLSDNQRARFHAALLQLKNGFGSYEYDRISFLHSNARMMPCAHGAPTFVLWHREFLKRLKQLQQAQILLRKLIRLKQLQQAQILLRKLIRLKQLQQAQILLRKLIRLKQLQQAQILLRKLIRLKQLQQAQILLR